MNIINMNISEQNNIIYGGFYRHFKGGLYQVICTCIHTETNDILVVYRNINDMNTIYARPLSMWNETIEKNGKIIQRFKYEGDSIKNVCDSQCE